MTNIEETLAERGSRYGGFTKHASIAQQLQTVMREQPGWHNLAMDQRQALTVISDKIARMLNGDPDYRDNWHDIIGYAKLVEDRLAKDEERTAMGPGLFMPPAPQPVTIAAKTWVRDNLQTGKTIGIPTDQDYGFNGTEQALS
jgi:hypothetical protein